MSFENKELTTEISHKKNNAKNNLFLNNFNLQDLKQKHINIQEIITIKSGIKGPEIKAIGNINNK